MTLPPLTLDVVSPVCFSYDVFSSAHLALSFCGLARFVKEKISRAPRSEVRNRKIENGVVFLFLVCCHVLLQIIEPLCMVMIPGISHASSFQPPPGANHSIATAQYLHHDHIFGSKFTRTTLMYQSTDQTWYTFLPQHL